MFTYITEEFPALIRQHFPIKKLGLMGHSMGGHGALTIALKKPDLFPTLSVMAPVCTPSQAGWGQDGLRAYLGDNPAEWAKHDAVELMKSQGTGNLPHILIDQGLEDSAYKEGRLNPEAFVEAAQAKGQSVEYRTHAGYDHGYFFVNTFIDDHLRHHARGLN
jgi:S-formylglutathione hydrolase